MLQSQKRLYKNGLGILDKQNMLSAKGGNDMPYKNVAELLLLNTNRFPDKTAIVYKESRITYCTLNQRVNQIVHALHKLGVSHGEKIGYMLPNSNQLVEVYFAIQKLGAIAVPLNTCLIPREMKLLLDTSECSVFIYSDKIAQKVDKIKATLKTVELFICSGNHHASELCLEEIQSKYSGEEPPLYKNEEAISRIQFTGGTTGVPKGVMRTHRNDITEIISVMMSSKMGANPDEVVLIQCPMEHHGGHSWFTSVIGTGATLVICDAFREDEILSLIERERVTYLLLLPPSTHLRLLNAPSFSKYNLSSVRLVQSAAGATTPAIIKRIYAGYPNCHMNYGWGQTESGSGSSLVLTLEMAEKELPKSGSIGKPMPFLEMKIIDENNEEVPVGEVGECIVRGPTTMVGYYNLPEENAKVFLKDGWMRTGDLMKKDEDGYFYLVSRKKEIIKSGGINVFVEEVSNVIRRHPAVEDCIVFGVPDRKLGEAVMTVVQLKQGEKLTLKDLQDYCKKYLSSYKKPLYMDVLDHFPMDYAGKIPKNKMVTQYREKIIEQQLIRSKS